MKVVANKVEGLKEQEIKEQRPGEGDCGLGAG